MTTSKIVPSGRASETLTGLISQTGLRSLRTTRESPQRLGHRRGQRREFLQARHKGRQVGERFANSLHFVTQYIERMIVCLREQTGQFVAQIGDRRLQVGEFESDFIPAWRLQQK